MSGLFFVAILAFKMKICSATIIVWKKGDIVTQKYVVFLNICSATNYRLEKKKEVTSGVLFLRMSVGKNENEWKKYGWLSFIGWRCVHTGSIFTLHSSWLFVCFQIQLRTKLTGSDFAIQPLLGAFVDEPRDTGRPGINLVASIGSCG